MSGSYGSVPTELKPEWFNVRAVRASGPGGQGVNTTDSKVELRFPLDEAHWLNDDQRRRMRELFPTRMNAAGEFILTSQVHRSQKQNLQACLEQLREMLLKASVRPKKRVATKATRGSVRRRLEGKSQRSGIKKDRTKNWSDS